MKERSAFDVAIGSVLLLSLAALIVFGLTRYRGLRAEIDEANAKVASLSTDLENSRTETAGLAEQLAAEKQRADELAEDKRRAEREVDELEELAKLDPELLAKYSKVYFLNENYEPPRLSDVPDEYVLPEGRELEINSKVLPFLRKMIEDAEEDGIKIRVASAYRSFEEQQGLKSGYSVTYGTTAANRFSADQGYSEHQLGTTVDLTTPTLGGSIDGFGGSDAFEWMQENAYRFGFILSYPAGNAYYQYEPWHWRFVGRDLARDLERKDRNFYDMDQRDIDTYLGEIFD